MCNAEIQSFVNTFEWNLSAYTIFLKLCEWMRPIEMMWDIRVKIIEFYCLRVKSFLSIVSQHIAFPEWELAICLSIWAFKLQETLNIPISKAIISVKVTRSNQRCCSFYYSQYHFHNMGQTRLKVFVFLKAYTVYNASSKVNLYKQLQRFWWNDPLNFWLNEYLSLWGHSRLVITNE